jgi:PIN domain nuclease of toxin-antitoxin system
MAGLLGSASLRLRGRSILGWTLVSESYLLDTNILYWMLYDSARLSPKARKAVQRGPLVASVASYWEVTIKSTKGTLPVNNPVEWWERAMDLIGAQMLPIRVNHVSTLNGLPNHHRDPFDRIIAA